MKRHAWLLASALIAGQALGAQADPLAVCKGFHDVGAPDQSVEAMRVPIERAIHTLDNAEIEPAAPILATGKLTYLSLSIAMPEDLDKVRVLGYFHLTDELDCVIPLVVNHIEAIKGDPTQPSTERTRIYFRVPEIDRLGGLVRLYRSLNLEIAAFGKEGAPENSKVYFGHHLPLVVSSKYPSVVISLLFAAVFYLIAAGAVASMVARETGALDGERPSRFARYTPWNIVCGSGQTALSQLQMLLFTLIVATLLFYQWLRTGLLQDLSTDLLYLIGISTLGAAGSQVTSSFKKGLDPTIYEYVQQLGWFTAPFARLARRADPAELLMTNKRFDTNKFQMLVFTFVIAAYVIASGASELDTLHISSTLLTLMGLSQGAYVGGNATSDTLAILQHQLRGMRTIEERYRTSNEPQTKDELRRRFELAAARAAAMFNQIFGRDITGYMLEIPIDADLQPGEGEAAPAQA